MKLTRLLAVAFMALVLAVPCGMALAAEGGASGHALTAAELQAAPLEGQADGYRLECDLPDGFTMRSTVRTFRAHGTYDGGHNKTWAQVWRVLEDGSLVPADSSSEWPTSIGWVASDEGSGETFELHMDKMPPGDYVVRVGFEDWSRLGRPVPDVVRDYAFTYQTVPAGGYVGMAVIDIEAFTIGLGYVEEPAMVPLYEGENAAQVLDRYLKGCGYSYQHTGSLTDNFYLGSISGGALDVSAAQVDRTVAREMERHPDDGYEFDPYGYQDENSLGQYDFSGGSGWMYSVNGDFPGVGFSDWHLNDGDVMRVQFTLALGADIGGGNSTDPGTGMTVNRNWYPVADKEEATAYLARINGALNARAILDDRTGAGLVEALKAKLCDIGASQPDVDGALDELRAYLERSGAASSVGLSQSELELAKGQSAVLEAEVGDGGGLAPQVVEWSTSDTIVATVDCYGKVTGHANGEAVITARLGSSTARCTVTVGGTPLEDFQVIPYAPIVGNVRMTGNIEKQQDDGSYLVRAGDSVTLQALPVPKNTTEPLSIAVESSDPQVATVQVWHQEDIDLTLVYVNAKTRGEAQVTARVGDVEHSVRVVVPPDGVEGFGFYPGTDASSTNDPGTGDGVPISHLELLVGDLSQANHGVVNVCPLPDANTAEHDPQGVEAWADDADLVDVYLARARTGGGGGFNFYRLHVYAKGDAGATDVHVRMGTYTRTLHVTVKQAHTGYENYMVRWNYADIYSRVRSAGDAGDSLRFSIGRIVEGFPRFVFSSRFVEQEKSGLKDWEDTDVHTVYFSKDDPDGVLAGDDSQVEVSGNGNPYADYARTGAAGTAWVHASIDAPYGEADEEYSFAVRVVEGDPVPVGGLDITGSIDGGSPQVLAEGGATYYDENDRLRWRSFAGELTVQAGGTLQLTADKDPVGATAVPVWTSSDQRVAKVDPQNGFVRLLRGGDASIMLSCGGYVAVLDLHVAEPVEQLSISPGSFSLARGETAALPLAVEPYSANAGAAVTWSSSAPEVATVDASGVVRAVGDGQAVVTATTANGKSASCAVTVGNPLSDAYFDYAPYAVSRGSTLDLASDLLFRNADSTDASPGLEGAQWSTSDGDVAAVDASGQLEAVGAGTCTVTARVHGLVARCKVTVSVPLEGLVMPEKLEIVQGETAVLEVQRDPVDATCTTGTVWTNSRESCVYMVSSGWYGSAVQLTGLKPGTSVVTVTLDGKSASCTVTVKRTASQQAVFDLQAAIRGWVADFPYPESPDADHAAYVAGADEIAAMWEALTDAQRAQVPEYGESYLPELPRVESIRAVAACEALMRAAAGDASSVAAAHGAYTALSAEQRACLAPGAVAAFDRATDVGGATVTVSAGTYTGKAVKPAVKVVLGGRTLEAGTDYSLSWSDNVNAGSAAKVTVAGAGAYHGSKASAFTIKKAANSAKAAKTKVTKSFKASALKSKAQSVALPKVTCKFGKPVWSATSKDKMGVLTCKSGKVQVKKGAAKGAYTIKLVAKVAATKNYAAAKTKTVTVTVTVK